MTYNKMDNEQNNQPESAKNVSVKHLNNINDLLETLQGEIAHTKLGFNDMPEMVGLTDKQIISVQQRSLPLIFSTFRIILNNSQPVLDPAFYNSTLKFINDQDKLSKTNPRLFFEQIPRHEKYETIPTSTFYTCLDLLESLRADLIMQLKDILFALSEKKSEVKRV